MSVNDENKVATDLPAEDILSDEIEAEDEDVKDAIVTQNEKKYINLYSGRALTLDEIYDITSEDALTTIVLLGPVSCGKTTIETTVYQLFLEKPFAGYSFMGSQTLLGFEERSFFTRSKSQRDKSVTPRTSISTSELFLHLKLLKDSSVNNFLFADMSGEKIEEYIANPSALASNLGFLMAVDNISIILDGEKIIEKFERNGVLNSAVQLLTTLVNADVCYHDVNLQIIISKYDIIQEALKSDHTLDEFIERIRNTVEIIMKEKANSITFHNVAAMPLNVKNCCIGYGLEELLDAWSRKNMTYEPALLTYNHMIKNEFDKLSYKLRETE